VAIVLFGSATASSRGARTCRNLTADLTNRHVFGLAVEGFRVGPRLTPSDPIVGRVDALSMGIRGEAAAKPLDLIELTYQGEL
jgi:hypothetical protein